VRYIEKNAGQDQETPVLEHQQKFQLHKQFWMLNEQGIDIIEHILNPLQDPDTMPRVTETYHTPLMAKTIVWCLFDYKPILHKLRDL
jgi:hypothetical protein